MLWFYLKVSLKHNLTKYHGFVFKRDFLLELCYVFINRDVDGTVLWNQVIFFEFLS